MYPECGEIDTTFDLLLLRQHYSSSPNCDQVGIEGGYYRDNVQDSTKVNRRICDG